MYRRTQRIQARKAQRAGGLRSRRRAFVASLTEGGVIKLR